MRVLRGVERATAACVHLFFTSSWTPHTMEYMLVHAFDMARTHTHVSAPQIERLEEALENGDLEEEEDRVRGVGWGWGVGARGVRQRSRAGRGVENARGQSNKQKTGRGLFRAW